MVEEGSLEGCVSHTVGVGLLQEDSDGKEYDFWCPAASLHWMPLKGDLADGALTGRGQ